jgi:hypothetical protein
MNHGCISGWELAIEPMSDKVGIQISSSEQNVTRTENVTRKENATSKGWYLAV